MTAPPTRAASFLQNRAGKRRQHRVDVLWLGPSLSSRERRPPDIARRRTCCCLLRIAAAYPIIAPTDRYFPRSPPQTRDTIRSLFDLAHFFTSAGRAEIAALSNLPLDYTNLVRPASNSSILHCRPILAPSITGSGRPGNRDARVSQRMRQHEQHATITESSFIRDVSLSRHEAAGTTDPWDIGSSPPRIFVALLPPILPMKMLDVLWERSPLAHYRQSYHGWPWPQSPTLVELVSGTRHRPSTLLAWPATRSPSCSH